MHCLCPTTFSNRIFVAVIILFLLPIIKSVNTRTYTRQPNDIREFLSLPCVCVCAPAIHKSASSLWLIFIIACSLWLGFAPIQCSILFHTQFLWVDKNLAFASPSPSQTQWNGECIWCAGVELNWKSWNQLIAPFFFLSRMSKHYPSLYSRK